MRTTAAVMLGAAGLAGCVTALHVTQHASVADGQAAPPFTLTAQDGTRVALASTLERGPVVLVFYRGYW